MMARDAQIRHLEAAGKPWDIYIYMTCRATPKSNMEHPPKKNGGLEDDMITVTN